MSDLKLAAAMDAELFDDSWTSEDFSQYIADHTCKIIGTFRDRKLVGYACVAFYGRRIAIDRLCINDGDDDDPATVKLIAAMKQILPAGGQVRLEIEVQLEDSDTLALFKADGFVARPWANGKYVHPRTEQVRLCYLPAVTPL